jgi:hypothetical protein
MAIQTHCRFVFFPTQLQSFLDLKLQITMEVTAVQNGEGDLALTRTKATASGRDAEGKPVLMSGNTVELVRRQPDGP